MKVELAQERKPSPDTWQKVSSPIEKILREIARKNGFKYP